MQETTLSGFRAALDVAAKWFDNGEADANPISTIKAMREVIRDDDNGNDCVNGDYIGLREAKELYDALRAVYRKGQGNAPQQPGVLKLSPEQVSALAKKAEREGVSVAHLERTLIGRGLDGLDIGHCRVCGAVQALDDNGYCLSCPRVSRY